MWPSPQETVDLVIFTEEILNEKLHFLYSVYFKAIYLNMFDNENLSDVFGY